MSPLNEVLHAVHVAISYATALTNYCIQTLLDVDSGCWPKRNIHRL